MFKKLFGTDRWRTSMQRLTIEIDVPSGVLPEADKEAFVREVTIAAVLTLVRRQLVSQGRAAQLLRISRAELLALLAQSGIPAVAVPGEQLAEKPAPVPTDLPPRSDHDNSVYH